MASLKGKFKEIGEGKRGDALEFLRQERAQYMEIPLAQIEPDPDQPRRDLGDLEELKASIREHGLIQPLIVSPAGGERFRIIAGERRYTAAKGLGMEAIECVVRTIEEHRRLETQLIENIHRKDFNPVEEAMAYRRLMDEFKLSQRALATRVARSPATINETLRILTLPNDMLESVRTSEHLSRSVLLEIAKQEDEAARRAMWKRASLGSLTVKAARQPQPSAPATREIRQVIALNAGSVTVRLALNENDEGEDDGDMIVAALEEALATAVQRFGRRS